MQQRRKKNDGYLCLESFQFQVTFQIVKILALLDMIQFMGYMKLTLIYSGVFFIRQGIPFD